jgi:DNA (cytosine-5-)-methyltransferase
MKSLEIFSGAGGLAKGLELAGFQHASFIELNKDACNSLRSNFNPKLVYQGDVADFDLSSQEGIEVIAGGPPCQPFSLGGKHLAHEDRRDMFPHAVRYVEYYRPKAFIFENVKGLLRKSFADYFEYILLRLTYPNLGILQNEDWKGHLTRLKEIEFNLYEGIKYKVSYQLLNAADYGVPQKRERVVIVGIRADLDVDWKFPKGTHSEDRLNWEKYVTGEYWEKHNEPKRFNKDIAEKLQKKYGIFEPEKKPWQTVRDTLSDIPHPLGNHKITGHEYRDGARIYSGHTGSGIDEPSKTIKAGGHGVPGGENMIRYDDGTVRYFTSYEAKLLQTFPEEFVISGAWGEAMRQIGNAVPVKLSEILGKHLMGVLSEKSSLHN